MHQRRVRGRAGAERRWVEGGDEAAMAVIDDGTLAFLQTKSSGGGEEEGGRRGEEEEGGGKRK